MFDQDEQEISQLIEMGLDAILSGRMTLKQFLAEHPDQASEIRPELETAVWLVSQQDQMRSRPGFVPASKRRVLDRIQNEAGRRDVQHGFLGFLLPHRPGTRLAGVLVAAVMALSSTGGLVSAAQGSLPGEFLYPVKRASEQVLEDVTLNEVQRVELNSQLAARRLDEAMALVTGGQYDAAKPALGAFEHQASRTVELLQAVSAQQPATKEALASAVAGDFLRQADRLEAMQVISPPAMGASLAQAQTASLQSASIAEEVADDLHQSTAPSTATPSQASATATASQTLEVAGTKTPANGRPSQPGAQDGPTAGSPTPPGHVVNTPRPTNVNRPTKAAQPDNAGPGNNSGNHYGEDKDNSNNNGNNNGKPGKNK